MSKKHNAVVIHASGAFPEKILRRQNTNARTVYLLVQNGPKNWHTLFCTAFSTP